MSGLPGRIAVGTIAMIEDEPYLSVDQVAERLGLPLGVLVRRVEAGDVPARRVDGPNGVRYELRLGDLGIEASASGARTRAAAAEADLDVASDIGVFDGHADFLELSGTTTIDPAIDMTGGPQSAGANGDADDVLDELVPAPTRDTSVTSLIGAGTGPLADVASMSIDPRELVAGLLDRWERTLEQRIYAEQRQRFEAELVARQNVVKQLQMELKASRAEHAVALGEKERAIEDRERRLADTERELVQAQSEKKRRGWFFRR